VSSADRGIERERVVVASVLASPGWLADVDLDPADLTHPHLAAAYAAMRGLARVDRPIELATLASEMRSGAAGPQALAELVDVPDAILCRSLGALLDLAREIRRDALTRRISAAAAALREHPHDDTELRALLAARDALGATIAHASTDVGFAGASLRALRSRVRPASPLSGILDDEPHLHLLAGRAKSGKTTFALAIARAWGLGIAPWPGARALPGSRVLVVSREQSATRIDTTMRRLDAYAEDDSRDEYAERVVVVARDAELPAAGRSLFSLDERGMGALRAVLAAAAAEGDPIGLVVLDSLSRLLPPGLNEIDNTEMSRWLDALAALAVETGTYVVVIHHVGHSSDPSRADARTAPRGASAIVACAQVVLLLERTEDPRTRRLIADGNSILRSETTYRVCGDDAEPGSIYQWTPVDPLAEYDPAELVGSSAISTSVLAWRLAGREPQRAGDRPPGEAMALAARLRELWARQGRVELLDGPRGARLIAMREVAR
jgi:replicative DNA helicase